MADLPHDPTRPELPGALGPSLEAEVRASLRRRLRRARVRLDDGREVQPLQGLVLDGDGYAGPLVDAWAETVGALGFYWDRVRAEGFLRTAVEPRSVHELVASIGGRPIPALSARVLVHFTVAVHRDGPATITVPRRTPLQSVPAIGGAPQVFETEEEFVADRGWNAAAGLPSTGGAGASIPTATWGVVLSGKPRIGRGTRLLLTGTLASDDWFAVRTVNRSAVLGPQKVVVASWDAALDPAANGSVVEAGVQVLDKEALLFGADAKPFRSLPLAEQLQHSPPAGGLHRYDAAQATWLPLEDPNAFPPPPPPPGQKRPAAPLGDVSCLHAGADGLVLAVVGKGTLLRSTDAGASWEDVSRATGRLTPSTFASAPASALLAGTVQGAVLRSSDGGISWDSLAGRRRPASGLGSTELVDGRLPRARVRALLSLAPSNSDIPLLLVGGDQGVFVWDEGQRLWQPIGRGLPGVDDATGRGAIAVRSLAVDTSRDRIVAATDRGAFTVELSALSKPDTLRWSEVEAKQVAGLDLTRVAIAAGLVWLLTSDGQVLRSADGLASAAPLPKLAGTRDLALRSPSAGGTPWLFVATDRGVLVSRDGGDTAGPLGSGLTSPDARVLAETPDGGLFVATPLRHAVAEAWPVGALAQGVLDVLAPADKVAARRRIGLVRAPDEPFELFHVERVEAVEATGFGTHARVARVHLAGSPDLSSLDRSTARVVLLGAPLAIAPERIERVGPISPPTAPLAEQLAVPHAWRELTRPDLTPSDAPTLLLRLASAPATAPGRRVIVQGRGMRVRFEAPAEGRALVDPTTCERFVAPPNRSLRVLERPTATEDSLRWLLATDEGRVGVLHAPLDELTLLPSRPGDPLLSEDRTLDGVVHERDLARGSLDRPLSGLLDPASIQVLGNVVEATHGHTIEHVLGSGDATRANQSFPLHGVPVTTHLRSDALVPDVLVRVDGVPWDRVEHLALARPDAQVWTLRTEPSGRSAVVFGDGTFGARLPTGANNVSVRYRFGAGPDGNVSPGEIRLILDQPGGLRGVTNPLPASGGTAMETPNELTLRAPVRMRSLDRIVSADDCVDFVQTLPGVARVGVTRVWTGRRTVTVLSVAVDGPDGSLQPLDDTTSARISEAVRRWRVRGAPAVLPALFTPARADLALVVAPGWERSRVVAGVRDRLLTTFAARRRAIALDLAGSSIISEAQAVRGVVNARLLALHPLGSPTDPPVLDAVRAPDATWAGGALVAATLVHLPAPGLALTVEDPPA